MSTTISEEDYVQLLVEECYARGLLGWQDHAVAADAVAIMGPFTTWESSDPFRLDRLEEEDVGLANQKQKVRRQERKELLEKHYDQYGILVQDYLHHRFFQLGSTAAHWLGLQHLFPINTLLYWIAAAWKLEEEAPAMAMTPPPTLREMMHAHDSLSDLPRPRQHGRLFITILGDVPQEPGYERDDGIWDMVVKPTHSQFHLDPNSSFADFKKHIVEFPLLRYHLTKHNPDFADFLFVPDDKVYPPGLHASWDENGNIHHPERFQKREDLVYDNGEGRGWWSGVMSTSNQNDLEAFRGMDWHALDTEADWTSFLQTLKDGMGVKAGYLYHQSVRERISFVQEQVEQERQFMADHQGYKIFNFLLKRHRDEEKDGGVHSFCGSRKSGLDEKSEDV